MKYAISYVQRRNDDLLKKGNCDSEFWIIPNMDAYSVKKITVCNCGFLCKNSCEECLLRLFWVYESIMRIPLSSSSAKKPNSLTIRSDRTTVWGIWKFVHFVTLFMFAVNGQTIFRHGLVYEKILFYYFPSFILSVASQKRWNQSPNPKTLMQRLSSKAHKKCLGKLIIKKRKKIHFPWLKWLMKFPKLLRRNFSLNPVEDAGENRALHTIKMISCKKWFYMPKGI